MNFILQIFVYEFYFSIIVKVDPMIYIYIYMKLIIDDDYLFIYLV